MINNIDHAFMFVLHLHSQVVIPFLFVVLHQMNVLNNDLHDFYRIVTVATPHYKVEWSSSLEIHLLNPLVIPLNDAF